MYKIEELVPIVAMLTEQYTGKESTSVTYEKADQLMKAVLYCIRETHRNNSKHTLTAGRLSAQRAYKIGYELVMAKVKKAMELYNHITENFDSYGNRCLEDTVIKGMPEFFRWYDVRFEPQNTILTLDYPILTDVSKREGVDAVYHYLRCISLEQTFLQHFDKQEIQNILNQYNPDYPEMIDNLPAIVCQSLFSQIKWKNDENLTEQMIHYTDSFVAAYYNNNQTLSKYLQQSIPDIAFRMTMK